MGCRPQMKGSFRQHGFTGNEGVFNLRGYFYSPLMMDVAAVQKRHDESRVGNPGHALEKPLRVERSTAPFTLPAKCMKGLASLVRITSSASLTRLPLERPEICALCSTHRASSSGRRMLSVVLICHLCTTFSAKSIKPLLQIPRGRHFSELIPFGNGRGSGEQRLLRKENREKPPEITAMTEPCLGTHGKVVFGLLPSKWNTTFKSAFLWDSLAWDVLEAPPGEQGSPLLTLDWGIHRTHGHEFRFYIFQRFSQPSSPSRNCFSSFFLRIGKSPNRTLEPGSVQCQERDASHGFRMDQHFRFDPAAI